MGGSAFHSRIHIKRTDDEREAVVILNPRSRRHEPFVIQYQSAIEIGDSRRGLSKTALRLCLSFGEYVELGTNVMRVDQKVLAARLHVQQPTISAALKELEEADVLARFAYETGGLAWLVNPRYFVKATAKQERQIETRYGELRASREATR